MLDFPNSPTLNQVFTAPNGVLWQWDGAKWVAGQGAATAYATAGYVDAAVATALHNTGRNLLHNPLFNVAQRGAGPFAAGYTLDRWQVFSTLDTVAISQVAFGPAALAADEAAAFALGNTFTGNVGAGSYNIVFQPVEDVRRLANKTVTVSFYANTGSGTLKLGVSLAQKFGTGGSPSPDVGVNGQSVTVGGGYARYSLTFTIPSISGKTLGTNNNHSTWLYFWYSSGATNNTQAGGVGVQSGTIYLWGVQLEIGSVATPLEKPDPRYDLSNCQRFYSASFFQFNGYATAGTNIGYLVPYVVTMRATPTVVPTFTTQQNCSGGATVVTATGAVLYSTVTATAAAFLTGYFYASADL